MEPMEIKFYLAAAIALTLFVALVGVVLFFLDLLRKRDREIDNLQKDAAKSLKVSEIHDEEIATIKADYQSKINEANRASNDWHKRYDEKFESAISWEQKFHAKDDEAAEIGNAYLNLVRLLKAELIQMSKINFKHLDNIRDYVANIKIEEEVRK